VSEGGNECEFSYVICGMVISIVLPNPTGKSFSSSHKSVCQDNYVGSVNYFLHVKWELGIGCRKAFPVTEKNDEDREQLPAWPVSAPDESW